MHYSNLRSGLRIVITAMVLVGIMGLVSCASQSPSTVPAPTEEQEEANAGSIDLPAADFTWSTSADCSSCHSKESLSLSDASCQVASSHGPLDCVTCHTDESALSDAHAEVTIEDTKGAKKLKKTEVSDDTCLGCHADDYAPEATADVTVLTDKNGTMVNPHELPETEKHQENAACSNCHDMHSDKTIEDVAFAYCRSCHHKDVYECNTCHDL